MLSFVMGQDWAHTEAKRVAERCTTLNKSIALFECGFGPSGLPHLGTVSEMVRTRMIQQALKDLGLDSRLILFADDLDALRKVPENVTGDSAIYLASMLGVPVCDIDNIWAPYHGYAPSYAEHNIQELVKLLRACRFEEHRDYELVRSSTMYRTGMFNEMLRDFVFEARAENKVKEIITRDFGINNDRNRKESYCQFLPLRKDASGIVRTTFEVFNWDIYFSPEAEPFLFGNDAEGPLDVYTMNGDVKLQWKADWPMRWMAFGVDYEMHGKDLIGSAQIGDEICQVFGHPAPLHMTYELFLDADGKKISKSKGNGMEPWDWLNYAPYESLEAFLKLDPSQQRRIGWTLIPVQVDEYLNRVGSTLPRYQMLLNLAGITNTSDARVLHLYVQKYFDVDWDTPVYNAMLHGAVRYYEKFILPTKVYRPATDEEKFVLRDLLHCLDHLPYVCRPSNLSFKEVDMKDVRSAIYDCGKRHYPGKELKNFFAMLYQVLMGQESGPQISEVVEKIGLDNFRDLVERAMV